MFPASKDAGSASASNWNSEVAFPKRVAARTAAESSRGSRQSGSVGRCSLPGGRLHVPGFPRTARKNRRMHGAARSDQEITRSHARAERKKSLLARGSLSDRRNQPARPPYRGTRSPRRWEIAAEGPRRGFSARLTIAGSLRERAAEKRPPLRPCFSCDRCPSITGPYPRPLPPVYFKRDRRLPLPRTVTFRIPLWINGREAAPSYLRSLGYAPIR